MKNETYVQINKPCHEDWAQMTPEDQGRFCAHCNKSVIDFSLMTDNQILSHLNKSNTNLCGRFHSEQLLRPLVETQLEPKKNWRYWLASISALFLLTNKSTAQLVKGNNDPINTLVTPKDSLRVMKGKVVASHTTNEFLKGIVVDSAGKPMNGACIRVKGDCRIITSDYKGRFNLNTTDLSDTFTIVVSYIGHETQKILINKGILKEVTVSMKQISDTFMGDIRIVRRKIPKGKNKSK